MGIQDFENFIAWGRDAFAIFEDMEKSGLLAKLQEVFSAIEAELGTVAAHHLIAAIMASKLSTAKPPGK